jgi:hypothetical protein
MKLPNNNGCPITQFKISIYNKTSSTNAVFYTSMAQDDYNIPPSDNAE